MSGSSQGMRLGGSLVRSCPWTLERLPLLELASSLATEGVEWEYHPYLHNSPNNLSQVFHARQRHFYLTKEQHSTGVFHQSKEARSTGAATAPTPTDTHRFTLERPFHVPGMMGPLSPCFTPERPFHVPGMIGPLSHWLSPRVASFCATDGGASTLIAG